MQRPMQSCKSLQAPWADTRFLHKNTDICFHGSTQVLSLFQPLFPTKPRYNCSSNVLLLWASLETRVSPAFRRYPSRAFLYQQRADRVHQSRAAGKASTDQLNVSWRYARRFRFLRNEAAAAVSLHGVPRWHPSMPMAAVVLSRDERTTNNWLFRLILLLLGSI